MEGALLLVVLAAFGLLVGTLSGLLGVGGGIFMVPFLVIVAGFGQQEAQATSLLVILPTAVIATRTLRAKGVGDLGAGMRIGVLGVLGSVLGALLALRLPGDVLRYGFAALLAVVAYRLIRDAVRWTP